MPPPDATAWAVTVTQMRLTPDGIDERPRLRGYPAPDGRPVTPVIHVDPLPAREAGSALNDIQQTAIVARVLDAASRSTSGWVQFDFEAVPSQRDSYHALVRRLRAALPASTKLSVTLLAWQCRSRAWMDPIAADEVVPMFFRLGRDAARWQKELADGARTLHPRCRNEAAGFSPQDTPPAEWQRRWPKRYWFNLARGRSTDWPTGAASAIWPERPPPRTARPPAP